VEAAGQLFQLFRIGLDYAFIRRFCVTTGAGRVIRKFIRILVPALHDIAQPVYESLRGNEGWPSITPRRCLADR
jgi:hypothetical protein